MPTESEIEQLDVQYAEKCKEMGITPEMETAVIEFLEAVGALTMCSAPDGTCTGGCPSGQYCKKLHNNNCLCVNNA